MVRDAPTSTPDVSSSNPTQAYTPNQPLYELSYTIRDAPAPWERTRIISISNRFVIHNDSPFTLRVKQMGEVDDCASALKGGESKPFHWASMHLDQLISLSCVDVDGDEAEWGWSGGVDPNQVGVYSIAIRPPASAHSPPSVYRTLKVHISTESRRGGGGGGGLGTEVVVSQETLTDTQHAPMVRIDNLTEWPVYFAQVIAHGHAHSVSYLDGYVVCGADWHVVIAIRGGGGG